MSPFAQLASNSGIWICTKCNSEKHSHHPFHYSLLYLTVSNSVDPNYHLYSSDPDSLDNNWRTLVINANSIAGKKAELAAIAQYLIFGDNTQPRNK